MPAPEASPRARTWTAALAGAVSAAAALAVAEVVTAFDESGTSLITAVGDEFIDRFAASLKDLAVALFGTSDKAALVIGIITTSLLLGAALAVEARSRPWIGPAGFAAFGLVGWWAYARSPLTTTAVGAVASALAALTGAGVLWVLLRLDAQIPAPVPIGRSVDDGVAGSGGSIRPAPIAVGGPTAGPSRRTFLATSASLGTAAVGVAMAGRRLRGSDPTDAARQAIDLPAAVDTPLGEVGPVEVPGLSPYITPTRDFYRIDTALSTPRVDVDSWRLEVGGMVDAPLELTFDELLAMEAVEVPVTLQCVSNQVGGDLVGTARWQGVPLSRLLERVGPSAEATQVVGRSVDGWSAGFPTEVLDDGRTALVAYAMNGEPLSSRHGFPARLVVAGLYGYVSATKWLTSIELTGWDDFDGYWVPRGWAKEGPIKTASRIDVPRSGAELTRGPMAVAGVAWSPNRGISRVELRVDDGPWQECTLGDTVGPETWVQWWSEWDAEPGEHVLTVRATDGDGEVQVAAVAPPAPDGATGLHARRVRVGR